MRYVFTLTALALLSGCSEAPMTAEPCRFDHLSLREGMNRADVEKQVADLLGRRQIYSPYGNNLQGGTVEYRDGDWVLEVKYEAGAPAPWIEQPDGKMVHYPPRDETLLEYKIVRIPATEREATHSPPHSDPESGLQRF